MKRHKNASWDLPDHPTTEQAILAALMDIRDELQDLNRKISSGRHETREAENAVRRIDKRLSKRIKLK